MKYCKFYKLVSTLLMSTLLITVLILSGCKQEMTSTLYVRDLVDATESSSYKTTMTSYAAIKLEMPSSETCNEKKDKLTRIISPFFINLEKTQCIEEGSDDFYYAVFELPMMKFLNKDGKYNNAKYKGGVVARLHNNDGEIAIYMSMNFDLLERLDENISSEFIGSGGIDPDDMKVNITINNDARDTYTLFVEGAFLDGQAIIPGGLGIKVDLERREESVVRLADVSVSALTGNGDVSFAYVASVWPSEMNE